MTNGPHNPFSQQPPPPPPAPRAPVAPISYERPIAFGSGETGPASPFAPNVAAGPPPPPVGQAPKRKRRGAKIAWIVTAVAVVVLAGLAVAGVVVRNTLATTQYGPTPLVEEYLQALVDGDAETAVGLIDPNVTGDERILLTNEIYQAAEGRPTEFEITTSTVSDNGATVDATVTMDSKRYDVRFALDKAGIRDVFFDDWTLVSGPEQALTVGYVATTPQVNGIDVDLAAVSAPAGASDSTTKVLPVLPGIYTFTAPLGTAYLTFGENQTVTVLPGQQDAQALVSFASTWTPQAENDALAQVSARIASCMNSDQFHPRDCPTTLEMTEPTYAVTGISRSWRMQPVLDFVSNSDSGQGTYVSVAGGNMHITYQWRWSETDTWRPDWVTRTDVFGSATLVPVTVGADGSLQLDFGDF